MRFTLPTLFTIVVAQSTTTHFAGNPQASGTDRFIEAMAYKNDRTTTIGYGIPQAFVALWWGWCARHDFNGNSVIDLQDTQDTAYRYGTFAGQRNYQVQYDLEPIIPDYDIDIKDLQKVWGRVGGYCGAP